MSQDLFDFDAAEARRDDGIDRAVAHAEANHKLWLERGVGMLRYFVEGLHGKGFLAEDFVAWLQKQTPTTLKTVFPKPPDPRAYGGIIQAAVKAGIIVKVGYAPAKSSNCSPKCLWRGK